MQLSNHYIMTVCKTKTLVLQELCKQVDDYIATYDPGDELEWSLVLAEIRAFIEVSGRCWCWLRSAPSSR